MAIVGLCWPPQWSGMVDMLVPDRYEISCSQKMVRGVIFGLENLILAINKEDGKENDIVFGVCVAILEL